MLAFFPSLKTLYLDLTLSDVCVCVCVYVCLVWFLKSLEFMMMLVKSKLIMC